MKVYGFWTICALITGNMIGSGVFMLPASLAPFGVWSLAGWALTGLGSLFLALVFCRLNFHKPLSGGPYAYCRENLGDFMGFQVAWNYWLSIIVGNAAVAVTIVGYLSELFPSLTASPTISMYVAQATIWSLVILNCVSVKSSGIFQVFITILKILALFLIIIVGYLFFDPKYLIESHPFQKSSLQSILISSTITMWAFIGLESGTIPVGFVKNPKKTIPRATIISTLFVTLFYMLLSLIMMGLIPQEALLKSQAPFATAAYILFGPLGKVFMAIAAFIVAYGSLNGWILLMGQVAHAVAKDGLFPVAFKKKNKNGVPVRSLIFSACCSSAIIFMSASHNLIAQFTLLITIATLSVLIMYFYTVISDWKMQLEKYAHLSPNSQFFKPLLISFPALIYVSWAILGAGLEIVYYGSILFFASSILYIFTPQSKKYKAIVHT